MTQSQDSPTMIDAQLVVESGKKGETPMILGRTVVVLPTYNEAENLPRMVSRLQELPISDLWILVVDDNSPDGTGRTAEYLRMRYTRLQVIHRPSKLGLGTAYVEGFKWALEMGANYVVQMDSDLSHDPEQIPFMLAECTRADVIVGSRYVEGGELEPNWAVHRKLLSAGANAYARTLLRSKVKDVTGGYKCWSRRALEQLELDTIRSNGYAFQIEMAHRVQRLGLRVCEVPIRFYERDGGVSKMSASVILEAAWRVCELTVRPWQTPHQERSK
jgi:dolichol-phosphate mannosyltransferase